MNFLICNGNKVGYHRQGYKSGPKVLFLHNGGTDRSIWSAVSEQLSKDYDMYCLDLPGYGQSEENPADQSLRNYADTVGDFVDQLQLKNITLVGNCLGSATSLEYCGKVKGENIQSLILFNVLTAKTLTNPANIMVRATKSPLLNNSLQWIKNKISGSNRTRIEAVNFQIGNRRKVPETLKQHLANLYIQPRNMNNLIALGNEVPGFTHLDALEKPEHFPPTMIIWGDKNRVLPYKKGKIFINQFKPDESHALKGGHLIMAEQEGESANLIDRFIKKSLVTTSDIPFQISENPVFQM